MSRQTALDNIYLRSDGRWGRTEYSLEYHKDYVRRMTGMEAGEEGAMRKLFEMWGIDLLWCTNDGLHDGWRHRGRATNMGHAAYAADGGDFVLAEESPFRSAEDVWAFDPAAEYGLPGFEEQVAAYEKWFLGMCEKWPGQLITGGYYKTLVSGAIEAFGWEMLLEAAADARKMERVWERFFRFTKHHMDAWARTSVGVVIQHDDFVWTSGAFMNPEVYRRVLIPMYGQMWKELKACGKKVLFCSDGTFTQFADDLAAAGADGFIFEPMTDWGAMTERFGKSHCLIGSDVDCRDLSYGTWETVRRKIDRTLELAKGCRGVILAVGNHLPANISEEMMERYRGYLSGRMAVGRAGMTEE